MKTTPRHHSDGIALIMVMCAIVVLSALAAGFALSMKVETRLAQNANSEEQLLWLGVSGVQYCEWVLAPGKLPVRFPESNMGRRIRIGRVQYELGSRNIRFSDGDGTFTWKIIDLERFANINTANATTIQQALILMGVDANEISVVSDSILDWIDADDLPRVAGAESDYYQGLNPPYYAKNAPIDDLSELQYIKGVTPEIYSGHRQISRPVFSITNSALARRQGRFPVMGWA